MVEDYENNTNKNFKRDISLTPYIKNLRFTAFIFLCRSCAYCHYFTLTQQQQRPFTLRSRAKKKKKMFFYQSKYFI
jgi:hypothetical protein